MEDDGVFRVQLLLLPTRRAQMEKTSPSINKQCCLDLDTLVYLTYAAIFKYVMVSNQALMFNSAGSLVQRAWIHGYDLCYHLFSGSASAVR